MNTLRISYRLPSRWWQRIAGVAACCVGLGLISWAANAEAQVTKLVPLGPPRQEPAQLTAETRPGANVGTDQDQWSEFTARQPRRVQRIAYDQNPSRDRLGPVSSDLYEARQAAYQPATPADIAPSLSPNGTTMSPWIGSSSVPAPASPGYSASPWTSASGVPVSPDCASVPQGASARYVAPSSTFIQSYSVPVVDPCASRSVGVAGSVPVAQGPIPPLLPITRPPRAFYVSSGLLGQPVIYAPGQPIRNFFRYFSF